MEACLSRRPLLGTLAAVDMSAFTFPGVGTYEAGPAIDALKTKHIAPTGPTANFASNAPRLQTIKSTSMASPGCANPHFTPTRMFFFADIKKYVNCLRLRPSL